MGGTTAKVGLIQDGQPSVTKDYNVGGHAGAGIGAVSLSGYPVRTPVDRPGRDRRRRRHRSRGSTRAALLRVGPQSAGADPGPVCYGRGGTEPTVTDANVVLGRLNPDYFLGGEMRARRRRARARAIEERLAEPLGLSTSTEAAHGIVEIANAAMVNALHLISVQRGYDPRDFVLVAFGGAGPRARERDRARARRCRRCSSRRARGSSRRPACSTTDLKRDAATTVMRRADEANEAELDALFAELERARADELAAEGLARDRDRVPAQARRPLRRPELRADDPCRRRPARALPRPARADVRLRGPGRAGRDRQHPPDERRPDRQAAGAHARGGRGAAAPRRTAPCTSPRAAATSTARSTTAARCRPGDGSSARSSSRSSTRPRSSTRATVRVDDTAT